MGPLVTVFPQFEIMYLRSASARSRSTHARLGAARAWTVGLKARGVL